MLLLVQLKERGMPVWNGSGVKALTWEQWHHCGEFYDGTGIQVDIDAWINPRTPTPMTWGRLGPHFDKNRRCIVLLKEMRTFGEQWPRRNTEWGS